MSRLSWVYAGLAPYLGGRPLCGARATGPGRSLLQGLPDIFRNDAARYLEEVRRVQSERPYRRCRRYSGGIELCRATDDLGNLHAASAGSSRTGAAAREAA